MLGSELDTSNLVSLKLVGLTINKIEAIARLQSIAPLNRAGTISAHIRCKYQDDIGSATYSYSMGGWFEQPAKALESLRRIIESDIERATDVIEMEITLNQY